MKIKNREKLLEQLTKIIMDFDKVEQESFFARAKVSQINNFILIFNFANSPCYYGFQTIIA